ncbi:MAG TPA: NHL repeat-containing protein, partial [Candidatus Binataceae bacterium]|nr:NHL repeat-containing protein [Candidatus Binataceae bacterium]
MKSTTMSAWRRLVWITVALVAAFTAAHPSRAHAGTTASRELGQVDFVHNAYNTVDPQVLAVASTQTGIAVDLSATPNHVYVTDPGNNRVLGYSSVTALTNGAPASIVIGQPDFASSSTDYNGITPTALSEPRGVAVDSSGNVYVADSGNNRVLVFSNPFTILNATGQNSGFAATMVLGQAGDFTSYGCNVGASNPSADTLCFPEGVVLDGSNNLYVADTSNNRVLEFNTPFPSGSFKANKVFGQFGNFTTNTANNSGVSKDSLNAPTGVAVDIHNNLYVADTTNNRVLEYNTPLTVTGIPGSGDTSADEVWGQGGSFGTANCNGGGVSATALCSPGKVALDASANLYIPDTSNNRVLEYNESANPPTNRTANVILGQTNSTSSSCNQGGANPSFATLCQPTSAAVDSGGNVFVVDSNNNRMVRYNAAISTDEAASVVIGQPDFVHKAENLVDPASLDLPRQIAIDASATPNHLFAADSQNSRVLGWLNAGGFANGAPADLVIGQPDFESSSC